MNGFSFRKNMVFEWHSVSYKIIKLEKNGDVVLQKQLGLEVSIASSGSFQSSCRLDG
jgi:hypothetical protein